MAKINQMTDKYFISRITDRFNITDADRLFNNYGYVRLRTDQDLPYNFAPNLHHLIYYTYIVNISNRAHGEGEDGPRQGTILHPTYST